MTTSEKVIKNKLGLLELSQQLGNVSRACKIMGYSRAVFIVSKSYMNKEVRLPYRKYPAVENIDHSKIKAKSPETSGICERFNRTSILSHSERKSTPTLSSYKQTLIRG